MGAEFGAVRAAESQVLVLFRERRRHQAAVQGRREAEAAASTTPGHVDPRGAFQPEMFVPSSVALAATARLVVHLTRTGAINVRALTLNKLDRVIGAGAFLFVLFSVGWAGSNTLSHMPRLVSASGVAIVAVLVGRICVVIVIRYDHRRAIRFRRLAQRDARHAVMDALDRELPELIRYRDLARRFGRPSIEDRLTAEITIVDNLRQDASRLSEDDLGWALRARLDTATVPRAGYRSALRVARASAFTHAIRRRFADTQDRLLPRIERWTAIPLTEEGSAFVAGERLDRYLRQFVREVNNQPVQVSAGEAGGE